MTAEKQISRMFSAARVLAILSVISAHIVVGNWAVISNFYSAIGSIGVVVFFIAAGYYLKREKLSVFLKKKAKTILLPWFILGSVVYILNRALNGSSVGVVSWVEWLVGYNTYLYFVTVIILCFVLFYYHNLFTLVAAIGLNALSLLLTCLGVLEPIVDRLHITNYLNVFNWIGFFAIGILLRRIPFEKSLAFLKRTRILALCLSVLCVVFIAFTGYKVGYFSPLGWAVELICAWSVLGLCTFEWAYNRISAEIAEMSFAIYILHMMFVGIPTDIFASYPYLLLFSNVIVLVFTYLLLLIGRYFARRLKLETVYTLVLGIRQRK